MAFISRDSDGKINGYFSCQQPDSVDGSGVVVKGVATFEIADNDPELLAYLAPPPAPSAPTKEELLAQIQSLMAKVEAL